MPPNKCQWDMVAIPSYMILYEGLAYPVQASFSVGAWTLWVELPQDKPPGWPEGDYKVPDIILEYKGPVLRNGFEELRRNIDAWIRGERQFKGEIPKPVLVVVPPSEDSEAKVKKGPRKQVLQ